MGKRRTLLQTYILVLTSNIGHSVENRLKFIDGQIYCILRKNIDGRQSRILLLLQITPTTLNTNIENQTKYRTWKVVLGYYSVQQGSEAGGDN